MSNVATTCGCPEHAPGRPRPAPSFARVETLIGYVTMISRLTDGRVMCQLCFEYVWYCQLNTTASGAREDVCAICAREEKA